MSRVKSAPKRLRRPVKRKKKRGPIVSIRKMLWILFLGSFLLFSLGSLGYVIFFRTVHAAEVKIPDKKVVVFEEPDPPVQDKTEIETSGSLAASPRIAIIIDDMGYHRKVGEELINLPLDLTYSFLPGAPFTELLEDHAHQKGRTVLLHLPLEPRDRKWNPGPGALYLGEMDRQREKIEENLTHVPHAIGINNHMGSLYSEDELHMAALIHIIKEKNLFYVDSFTTAESVGMRLAQEIDTRCLYPEETVPIQ